jgi:hypothetical protein
MLNGCCLSFCSDDALGGEVCVVPVLDPFGLCVSNMSFCIEHVVLCCVNLLYVLYHSLDYVLYLTLFVDAIYGDLMLFHVYMLICVWIRH